MNIPFIDLHAQYKAYQSEMDAAMQAVLNSTQFIMGEEVKLLEAELANYVGVKHAIACANGTDALQLALMALDIQPGDEVITTPFTFIATASMVAHLRAKPIFVDIQADTYNIDPSKIADKITPKTRAIIPVSLYGQPADMAEINAIAAEYSRKLGTQITVIEDAAQSFGAQYHQKKSGNLSTLATTSFFPSKPLGCYGDGGALFTQDDELAARLKQLRVHGQIKRYVHAEIGLNSRLDTLQAAILRVKLKHLDSEIEQRHKLAERYNQRLKNTGMVTPVVKPDRTSVYAQYSLRTAHRDELMQHLNQKGIPTAVHYPIPLHLQACFQHCGYQALDFPISEQVSQEIISLPMGAFLTLEDQDQVISACCAFAANSLLPT